MEKTLVLYYSKTGSNTFLAEQFASRFNADIEKIRPKLNGHLWLMILSLLKVSSSIYKLKNNPTEYEKIILCSPIWTGKLIAPARGLIEKYKKQINKLYFATCCGGDDAMKEDKFGYMHVFREIEKNKGSISLKCQAFPIPLLLPEGQQKNGDQVMKTRLSEDNFKGEILKRFELYCDEISGM